MSTVAVALLLAATGSGPAGSSLAPGECSAMHVDDPAAAALRDAGHAEDARNLAALFARTPTAFPSRGLPVPVRVAFADPFRVPEVSRAVTAPAAAAGDRPFRAVAEFAARAFGVRCGAAEERSTLEVSDPQRAVFALDFLLNESNLAVKEALAASGLPEDRTPAVRAATGRALETVSGGKPSSEAMATAMGAAMALDRAALVRAALHFDARLDVQGDWSKHAPEELPPELAGATEGTVLTAQLVPELGWIVVGGPGPNRYDMTRIAAVFDPAGDDRYDWGAGTLGSRLVVDVAGDDVHEGRPFPDGSLPTCGAAGAACGVSVVDDWSGNDRYGGSRVALGAATFGVGILVDRAGNDRYAGGQWTQAAAFGGIGALCDLAGDDLYEAQAFSQACGGPGGASLLLDVAEATATAPTEASTASTARRASSSRGRRAWVSATAPAHPAAWAPWWTWPATTATRPASLRRAAGTTWRSACCATTAAETSTTATGSRRAAACTRPSARSWRKAATTSTGA